MKCDCCGKQKKLFDMFYTRKEVDLQVHLCTECNDLAERIRQDVPTEERELFELRLAQWNRRAKDPSPEFLRWKRAFLAPYLAKLGIHE